MLRAAPANRVLALCASIFMDMIKPQPPHPRRRGEDGQTHIEARWTAPLLYDVRHKEMRAHINALFFRGYRSKYWGQTLELLTARCDSTDCRWVYRQIMSIGAREAVASPAMRPFFLPSRLGPTDVRRAYGNPRQSWACFAS